jgi:hypothetical protein
MPADRFLIAPYDKDSGVQTNYKPWLIPDEAFSELLNAYVFRGRVRKRFGSRWLDNDSLLTRLRINIGTITGGSFSGNIRTINSDAGMPTAVGQAFSVLDTVFTVVSPVSGVQQMLRSDGSGATATYDLDNSAFNITATGAPDGTLVYFYPALPVMGILTYEQNSINDEFSIAFDTRYAYQYGTGWDRLPEEVTPGAAVWTGNNSQFFWACTWTGAGGFDKVFFVTNFNENELNFMRTLAPTPQTTGPLKWDNFQPVISDLNTMSDPVVLGITLNSARIIVPFKNRLVVFNTWENETADGEIYNLRNYVNRARYSAVGSPLASDAWRQDIQGQGSGIDCPTTESIVSAEFVKDRLIVFFERSTWEFVYTGNQAYPFVWQQINTELGAESTFSVVPFDTVCLGVGNVGIHACNGSNVERIDSKIPDAVWDIHNLNQGIYRVYGIRDYFVEMVYWTFPDIQANDDFPYPNRVLVYNYKTGTWAFNDDSITCFGYYQPSVGVLWSDTTVLWSSDVSWASGTLQGKTRLVIGGNQQGYTFICDPDEPTNASVLQITEITELDNTITLTSIDHNLSIDDYVYLEGITGTGNLTLLNGMIFQIINTNYTNATFSFIFDDGMGTAITGTYSGAGLIGRVSQISIKTKEYNFYAKQGRNAYIQKVDFMVDSTSAGQIQADFYVSTAETPLLQDAAGTGTLVGTGTLDYFPYIPTNPGVEAPIQFERTASRLWHPVYFQADGEVVQIQLVMNDDQMRNTDIRLCGFQLHAMVIYAQSTASRFQ